MVNTPLGKGGMYVLPRENGRVLAPEVHLTMGLFYHRLVLPRKHKEMATLEAFVSYRKRQLVKLHNFFSQLKAWCVTQKKKTNKLCHTVVLLPWKYASPSNLVTSANKWKRTGLTEEHNASFVTQRSKIIDNIEKGPFLELFPFQTTNKRHFLAHVNEIKGIFNWDFAAKRNTKVGTEHKVYNY